MSQSFGSALSGAALGGALTYAAVSQPSIILDQFAFKDMHMLRTFMTATAGSAILTSLLSRLDLFTPYVRPPVSLSFFSRYDGNIIGGFLIGTGMALTGACPGSVIPQLATGIPSAWPAFLGALTGGMLWVTAGEEWALKRQEQEDQRLRKRVEDERKSNENTANGAANGAVKAEKIDTTNKKTTATKVDTNTFQGRLGISYDAMLLIYISACASVVTGSTLIDKNSSPHSLSFGIKSGLGIAFAQAVSMLATGNALCSSGAFEESARWILWAAQRALGRIDGSAALPKPPPCSNAGSLFAVGQAIGAVLVARVLLGTGFGSLSFPMTSSAAAAQSLNFITNTQVGKLFAGGVALGFGARLANGCTSGHGISGMSAMSVASLITVATMFGGGMAVAAVL